MPHGNVLHCPTPENKSIKELPQRGSGGGEISVSEAREFLMRQCRNIFDKLNDGSSLLHMVVSRGSQKLPMLVLEECFGDPNEKNYNGRTPLHVACVSAPLSVIKYLVHRTFSPHAR